MHESFLQSPSHAYYITTVVYDRLPIFTQPSTIIPLFDSLNYYRAQVHMRLLGYVVMPEHMHLLLWPQQKDDMETFMRG
ncbi:MAG: transposase, partial [Caldilineaceae bacterium]|nr:transposase [Caldilineaceae bacterium]